jgi:hypothetical protein
MLRQMNCLLPGGDNEPSGPDEDKESQRGALVALVIVVVLVFVGLGLFHILRHAGAVQDCAMQGRSNCVSVQ